MTERANDGWLQLGAWAQDQSFFHFFSRMVRLGFLLLCQAFFCAAQLGFVCSPTNDLYVLLVRNSSHPMVRYDTPIEAIAEMPHSSGILILADGYPRLRTDVSDGDLAAVFNLTRKQF